MHIALHVTASIDAVTSLYYVVYYKNLKWPSGSGLNIKQ